MFTPVDTLCSFLSRCLCDCNCDKDHDSEEVTALVKGTSVINILPSGPFFSKDVYRVAMHFFDVKSIVNLSRTSKWNMECSEAGLIWQELSRREGIPEVANEDGTPRKNPKKDFKVLYPITLSGRKTEQLFDVKIVGQTPKIRQKWFDRLFTEDPFEPEKSIRQNYEVIVVPSCVRTENPKIMTTSSGKEIVIRFPTEEEEVEVPFSLPFFCKYSEVLHDSKEIPFDEYLISNSTISKVYFMRKKIFSGGRNLQSFREQEYFINKKSNGNFKAALLLPRLLLDSYYIYKKIIGMNTFRTIWTSATTERSSIPPCRLGICQNKSNYLIFHRSYLSNENRNMLGKKVVFNTTPCASVEFSPSTTTVEQLTLELDSLHIE